MLPYYALSLNVDNLSGDMFVNFVLSSLPEYPCIIVLGLLLDRMGEALRASNALKEKGTSSVEKHRGVKTEVVGDKGGI